MGSGLSADSASLSPAHRELVVLTRCMRDLGVKRFEMSEAGVVSVEIHDAATALALQPPTPEPVEAGELDEKRRQQAELAERERLDLELASA